MTWRKHWWESYCRGREAGVVGGGSRELGPRGSPGWPSGCDLQAARVSPRGLEAWGAAQDACRPTVAPLPSQSPSSRVQRLPWEDQGGTGSEDGAAQKDSVAQWGNWTKALSPSARGVCLRKLPPLPEARPHLPCPLVWLTCAPAGQHTLPGLRAAGSGRGRARRVTLRRVLTLMILLRTTSATAHQLYSGRKNVADSPSLLAPGGQWVGTASSST